MNNLQQKNIASRKQLQDYLRGKVDKKLRIRSYKKLGSGWHNTGYKVVYSIGGIEKKLVLRLARPYGFGHDFPSDRARLFVMQHNLSRIIPLHIKSVDVGGVTAEGKMFSIGSCAEFFQLVEPVKGVSYFEDLESIKKRSILKDGDKKKAKILSDYLVELHKIKFKGNSAIRRSIHRRHTRDCIGDGEMLIGVLDTYPDKIGFTNKKRITRLIEKAVEFRERIKDKHDRLCRMHGDFHPANIYFSGKNFTVMDASRELWGEPADDLTALGINYIWYALMQKGRFIGPFKELFDIFWENYMRKTKDYGLNTIAPLFFAFRSVVIAHPVFYRNQSNTIRRKIFNFANNVLSEKRFDYRKINQYIK